MSISCSVRVGGGIAEEVGRVGGIIIVVKEDIADERAAPEPLIVASAGRPTWSSSASASASIVLVSAVVVAAEVLAGSKA